MTIYFRVHESADDTEGTLFDSKFNEVPEGSNFPGDLILTASADQFAGITGADPTHVIIRVYEDKNSRDLNDGELYDENLRPLLTTEPLHTGSPVLFTITPDEFDAVRASRD